MKHTGNAAIKVSVTSMAANFILSLFKLFAGIFANSAAMISDAVHSASDVISTIVVIIGIRISEKEPDSEHPYGHERMECVAALILASMLFVVGIEIGKTGLKDLIKGTYAEKEMPGALALIAAIVSIAVKELMYHYTMHTAKKVKSAALKADAWHHRSDALSSVGALIGIGFAMYDVKIADTIASLVICIFIIKAAVDIFREGANGLVDHSCKPEIVEKIRSVVLSVPGVEGIDELKSRMFGSKMYVDVEITADGSLHLSESHEIARNVHDLIESSFPETKHCMVHVNPKE